MSQHPMQVKVDGQPSPFILNGFEGQEALSRLFAFQLHALVEDADGGDALPFDQYLGKEFTVSLAPRNAGDGLRYFSGVCTGMAQRERVEEATAYHMQLAPKLWLWTRRVQSRIFQHLTIPDILKKVLEGLEVTYQIQGTFHPRDYCVQYRESDFSFASRLMEEEGIFYFFTHDEQGHKLIVANQEQSHPSLAGKGAASRSVPYEDLPDGLPHVDSIYEWSKQQQLRSGKITLWDHCFEVPGQHLEAEKAILAKVKVGQVEHALNVRVARVPPCEIYDYPGEYAQRFDGVDAGGSDQPDHVGRIFQDNQRTATIRIQEEALQSVLIHGSSNCRRLVSGSRFTLVSKCNAKAQGDYVLTSVAHRAHQPAARSAEGGGFHYHNSFTCIPAGLPYRPPRVTPKPPIPGTQTAVVVGPKGEEIFTDKYGRVKVQFHWDREGKRNADSSCWIRVGSLLAGRQWGMIHLPRVGQEVIVDFLEGDPDQPLIVGSVYNAEQMPPYKLPEHRTRSGLRSRSTLKGSQKHFNELRFEDKKGVEEIYLHAEKDFHRVVEHDDELEVRRHQVRHIAGNMELCVDTNQDLVVKATKKERVDGDDHLHVKSDRKEQIDGTTSLTVGKDQQEKVGRNHALDAGQEIHVKAGMKIIIEAGAQISLKGPGGFIDIGPGGVTIQGTIVLINSGGAAGSGSGASPQAPEDAKEAKTRQADDSGGG